MYVLRLSISIFFSAYINVIKCEIINTLKLLWFKLTKFRKTYCEKIISLLYDLSTNETRLSFSDSNRTFCYIFNRVKMKGSLTNNILQVKTGQRKLI